MVKIFLLKASLIFILLGCSSQRKNINEGNIAKAENLKVGNKPAQDKILFLTLNMTLTDSVQDTYQFSLLQSVFAEGSLKHNLFSNEAQPEPYYLYCEITDDSKKRIDFIKVKNPLQNIIEYSSEPGTLGKKLFVTNTGQVFLRFQFTNATKYLTIYKPQPDLRTLKKIYHAQI